MASDLLRFKKIVTESKNEVILSSENFLFQVLGMYCYLADAHYLSCLASFFTPSGCESVYLYDIIIADNQYKQKCLLHPKLSDLVQKSILQTGHLVKVNKVVCLYYEVENSFPYIILTDIDIKDKKKISVSSNLLFTSHNKREVCPIPLVTLRQYYVNTWLMHIPYMPCKNSESTNDGTRYNLNQETISLCELAKEWKTMIRPYPPVLVSVILQGRLHHYGKNSKNNPFPFQGYLDVADETGIVSAVLWDSINIDLFSKIKPGAVIFIQNYNVVNKYPCSSTSVLRHKLRKLEKYPLELKINKNSSVHIVDRCFLKEHLNTKRLFPMPQYWFATRKILGNLPTETNVDIVALTVYVGCYIREQCLDIHGNPRGGFWTYRWIELIDPTSSLPIILQVYVNDQLDIHEELQPGQILMCSQLRLVHVPFLISKSFHRRDFYLTTTWESKLMICKENEFEKSNEFLNLIDMMKSKDIMPQLKKSVFRMGGIYNYPPCQKSLELFKASIPRERVNFLTPSDVWKQEFNSLSYKEVRRINVTGFIVKVIYFSCMKNGWIENVDNQIPKLIFNDIHRLHSGKYDILGNFILESNAFAHQYSPENEKVLRNWLSFAPFSADQNTDENLEGLKDISIYYPGYYRIDIAAVNYNIIINSFLFVEPSNPPHPSFVKLLSGDFSMESKKFYGFYDSIELKNQFDNVQQTVFEILGKKMLCILDLYSNSPGNADVLLKRAFPSKEEISQSV